MIHSPHPIIGAGFRPSTAAVYSIFFPQQLRLGTIIACKYARAAPACVPNNDSLL